MALDMRFGGLLLDHLAMCLALARIPLDLVAFLQAFRHRSSPWMCEREKSDLRHDFSRPGENLFIVIRFPIDGSAR